MTDHNELKGAISKATYPRGICKQCSCHGLLYGEDLCPYCYGKNYPWEKFSLSSTLVSNSADDHARKIKAMNVRIAEIQKKEKLTPGEYEELTFLLRKVWE